MGHNSRSKEDLGDEYDLKDYGKISQEISKERNFIMLPRDHSCDVLVKKVTAFCPCLKNCIRLKWINWINSIGMGNLKKAWLDSAL